MKERELRTHADCSICGDKIGASEFPRFFRMRVDTFLLNGAAIARQQGLTMQLGGNAMIAQAMGPDEELANQVGHTVELTCCESCARERPLAPLMAILEKGREIE